MTGNNLFPATTADYIKIATCSSPHHQHLPHLHLLMNFPSYCNFKTGLLKCSTGGSLQIIQNAAETKQSSVSQENHIKSLLISLQWLLIASRIKFKVLPLAFRTSIGVTPSYLDSPLLLQTATISERVAPCFSLTTKHRFIFQTFHPSLFLSTEMSQTPAWLKTHVSVKYLSNAT